MVAAQAESWILDDAQAEEHPADVDRGGGHPVWNDAARLPFAARLMAIQLALVAGVPGVLGLGYWLHGREDYYQWLFGFFLAWFAFSIFVYLRPASTPPAKRPVQAMAEARADALTPLQLLVLILTPVAVLLAAVVAGELCARRFVGAAVFALLGGWSFFTWGARPIAFIREFLLAQPYLDPDVRYEWPRTPCGPDLGALLVMLSIVVLVPVYTSASHALVALLAYCLWKLQREARRLRVHGPLGKVVPYLLRQADHWAMVYLDYADVRGDQRHLWAPVQTNQQRRLVALALLAPLYLALLVGTSFYCPWEWFAAGSLVDFELGWF